MDIECATFHLNTTNISSNPNVTNQYGSINADRNDVTWYNVSLKTILGDMFDKYDKYNIKLITLFTAISTTPVSSNSADLNLQINITGLPFSNCTYNTKFNSNTSSCVLGSFTLNPQARILSYNDDAIFTIEKPTETHNIQIFFTTLNNTAPVWSLAGPNFDLYFRIYPCKN